MYNYDMKLKVKNLNVYIDTKQILNDINFNINENDVIAIIGPNGHGKSTILKSIINHYSLTKEGSIRLNSNEINNLTTNQIANLGIFYCSQNPVEIPGITQLDLYKSILNNINNEPLKIGQMYLQISKNLKKLNLDESVLERYVNVGFSGGEKKKNEILQMLLLDPNIILLDEIDSGLDIDTFNIISNIVLEEIKKNKSVVFVTHNYNLINKLNPNKVLLVVNGKIVKEGDKNLADEIFNIGFNNYFKKNNIKIDRQKQNYSLGSCGVKHEKTNQNK